MSTGTTTNQDKPNDGGKAMSDKAKRYVDIRIHFTEDVEEYRHEDGTLYESFTSHDIDYVERTKIKGITEDELDALGESFGQVDAYHLFFQNELPLVISDGRDMVFTK